MIEVVAAFAEIVAITFVKARAEQRDHDELRRELRRTLRDLRRAHKELQTHARLQGPERDDSA